MHVGCAAAAQPALDLSHAQRDTTGGEPPSCDAAARYGGAKTMLAAFSAEHSRRRRGTGVVVTSNVYDPVAVDTATYAALASRQSAAPRRMAFGPQALIRRALSWVLAPLLGPVWRYVGRMFMRDADTGGKGLVHVATSPHLTRVSGKHFTLAKTALTRAAGCTRPREQCGVEPPPAAVTADVASTAALWDQTHDVLSPWLD